MILPAVVCTHFPPPQLPPEGLDHPDQALGHKDPGLHTAHRGNWGMLGGTGPGATWCVSRPVNHGPFSLTFAPIKALRTQMVEILLQI